VLYSLVTLVVIALALLLWRLASGAEPEGQDRPRAPAETQPESVEPEVPPDDEMPELIGMDKDAAKALLKDAGYEPVEAPVEDEAEEGTVIATDPEAGANLEPGQEVILYVSTGEEEDDHGKGDKGKGKGKGKDEEGDD
jgi:hypothetical protein